MNFVAISTGLNCYPKLNINDYKAHLRTQAHVKLNYCYRNKSYHQTIYTTTTPCNYGAYRYWWLCPKCGRRVGVLYCKDGLICRHCVGACYESQLSQPIDRVFMRLANIHGKLGCKQGLLSEPIKPKGMHQTTFNHLINQREQLFTQIKGYIAMLDFSKSKPKKPLSEITLEDIFKELDTASFIASIKGHSSVLVAIPVIKAKLLGLDKGRLEDVDGKKPLFEVIELVPEIAKDNEALSDKTIDSCIKILKATKPKKNTPTTKAKK